MSRFDTISKLSQPIINNLNQLNYKFMTPIQEATIPILMKRRDIIARAKTGSGKTAAFGIPTIDSIDISNYNPQALILSPTRELADQVAKELRRLARYRENLKIITLCGGTPMAPQISSLSRGAHIIIGTPGRLQDHLSRETIYLKDIKKLVLDEADRMLDMGFYDEIIKIISNISKDRHTMLFSATYPENIERLAREILKDHLSIEVDTIHHEDAIKELVFKVTKDSKIDTLLAILKSYKPKKALIFCNTKVETLRVTNSLYDRGFSVSDLQGDLDQRERNETLLRFANGSTKILVATDVASRGLDVDDISLVINYDIPHKADKYTHRIGRTARAGSDGVAITLSTHKDNEKLQEYTSNIEYLSISQLKVDERYSMEANYTTISINGGKRSKLRPGDIVGTLIKEVDIPVEHIGKIDIFEIYSYVAIDNKSIMKAIEGLKTAKIKKRRLKSWII
jgi:ATP-independent RNA helicase DbpA